MSLSKKAISSCKGEFFITSFLLLNLGIWFWGFNDFISLLPSLNWTRHDRLQGIRDHVHERQDDSINSVQPPKVRKNFNIFQDFLTPKPSIFCNNYSIHR